MAHIDTFFSHKRVRPDNEDDSAVILRAAVADKHLRVMCRAAGSLAACETAELLALMRRNMERFVGRWDERERGSDLTHGGTRLIVLRSAPTATSASLAGSLASDSDGARRVTRKLAAGNVQRGDTPESRGDGTLAGFAAYRFVVQETLRVVYLLELQIDERWRRQGLGSLLLDAVDGIGRAAGRQGLLLSVHLTNDAARRFYRAKGLVESPISPAQCAPPQLALRSEHEIMQRLWDSSALKTMGERGDAARRKLHQRHSAHDVAGKAAENCAQEASAAATATPLPPARTPAAAPAGLSGTLESWLVQRRK